MDLVYFLQSCCDLRKLSRHSNISESSLTNTSNDGILTTNDGKNKSRFFMEAVAVMDIL